MPVLAQWYFDVVSPYSYLQTADLDRLPSTIEVVPKPVLLGALLKTAGIKAPADVPAKRLHLYRQCVWFARQRNIPFCMPPRHPFNSLAALRLLCSLGPTIEQAHLACKFVFGQGNDPSTPEGLRKLAEVLGIQATEVTISAASNKAKLRANTDEAVAFGAWGVPTFVVNGELFWGADSFPMVLEFLNNSQLFETPEMKRVDNLPSGIL
jgi:2-hydroxychromene-2-carboxylate isomerase